MSEEESQRQRITRRDILKWAGLVLADLTVGVAAGFFLEKWIFDNLPDNPSSETSLRSTAVAVAKEGKKSQFVERGEFTNEFFDQCCRGTFALEIFRDKLIVQGTCWLAMIDGEGSSYFVTNRHVFDYCRETPIGKMRFWRPIDSEAYHPSTVEAVVSASRDLAVIKCKESNPSIQDSDVLNWQDNVYPRKGQDLLAIGYPQVFRDINDPGNFLTCASYIRVEEILDSKEEDWMAKGLISRGGSGSPVIEVDMNGNPKVLGVLREGGDNVILGKPPLERKENVVYGCKLEVGDLIKLFPSV